MKLGHISDLHVLSIDKPRPWQFLNKRLVGGANLLFNRSKGHSSKVVKAALSHLEAAGIDHLAVTGDLSNLALDSEFEAGVRILRDVVDEADERVTVIPGNHDYYTYGVARQQRFERYFARFQRTDLPEYRCATGYPFCKLLDDRVALVGVNSAIPTPWFFATGRVDANELDALDRLLADERLADRFVVVMVHHHLQPFEHSRVEFTRRLINAADVLRTVRRRGVDLVIHGHNHHFSTETLPHLDGDGVVRICEAGSVSVVQHDNPHFGGKFNIYHVEDGALARIETHLFDSHDAGFVEWHDQVFTTEVADADTAH